MFIRGSPPDNPFPQKYNLIFIIAGIWVLVSSCSGCCITCKTKFTGKCNKIIMSIYIIISLVGASLHMVCTSCLMVLMGMIKPGIYQDLYDWFEGYSLGGISYSLCCENEWCAPNNECSSEESYINSKILIVLVLIMYTIFDKSTPVNAHVENGNVPLITPEHVPDVKINVNDIKNVEDKKNIKEDVNNNSKNTEVSTSELELKIKEDNNQKENVKITVEENIIEERNESNSDNNTETDVNEINQPLSDI